MKPFWSALILLPLVCHSTRAQNTGWAYYGGDAGGARYSPLTQINKENVNRLKTAWTFHTGDVFNQNGGPKTKFEATPILFNDTLFVSTPFNRVIALDPENGALRWAYDPKIDLKRRYSESLVSRGVSAWEDKPAAPSAVCKHRIFLGTLDARLIALDADRGTPCANFGAGGSVDLAQDVGKVDAGQYEITSPVAVINDIVVVGSAIGDNRRVDVERGTVRAFNARTGALLWSWDPIPRRKGQPGYESWTPVGAERTGAANAWSAISADPARDLVFIPTGSASPDFYGGERLGNNLFANCVVAIRASTGQIVWHFQVVHHDLWDYDVAPQPLLTTVRRDGKDVAAVVVNTKMGHVFVLDRDSGKPLFPIEERRVPASDVPAEEASRTQPFPVLPPPLYPQHLSADDAWGADEAERKACHDQIAALRYEGIFTPPSVKGTMIFPGYVGGVNWGSASADPKRGIMVINVNQLAFWVRLIPRGSDLTRLQGQYTAQSGTPYGMARELIRSPKGNPCVPPPWSRTVAIDLNKGNIVWEAPADGPSFGGAMTTAAGLTFVSGATDQKFRALDIDSGKELWSVRLPAGGQAPPMTYQTARGKQYVVISSGGHGDLPVTLGDSIIAFALP